MSVREIAALPAPLDVRGRVDAGIVSWPDTRAALLGFGSAVLLATFDGGFYPTTWGWTALALSWAAALALLLRPKVRVRAVELAVPGLLTAFLVWVLVSLAWTTSRRRRCSRPNASSYT